MKTKPLSSRKFLSESKPQQVQSCLALLKKQTNKPTYFMSTNTVVATCCHLTIKCHTALTQVTPWVAHNAAVTCWAAYQPTAATLKYPSHCRYLSKNNYMIIGSEKNHLLCSVKRVQSWRAEAGSF